MPDMRVATVLSGLRGALLVDMARASRCWRRCRTGHAWQHYSRGAGIREGSKAHLAAMIGGDLPAAERRLVADARIDPGGMAVATDLLFPERRVGLEVVHQEFRRL